MVYEVMLQMGPIHNIHMPRDRVTQNHQGFGFVEFRSPTDAEYAAGIMNGIKIYGKSLRVNKASADKQKQAEVGANLFVGNLDPMVDEQMLYDTFSRFGPLLSLPKVAREENSASKGFGFVSYADFESSDAAIQNIHGQYILSKEVSCQYAFKRDGKSEKHGTDAERELAAQAKSRNVSSRSDTGPISVHAASGSSRARSAPDSRWLRPVWDGGPLPHASGNASRNASGNASGNATGHATRDAHGRHAAAHVGASVRIPSASAPRPVTIWRATVTCGRGHGAPQEVQGDLRHCPQRRPGFRPGRHKDRADSPTRPTFILRHSGHRLLDLLSRLAGFPAVRHRDSRLPQVRRRQVGLWDPLGISHLPDIHLGGR